MKDINNVNYESNTSSLHNYSSNETPASPDSFSSLVGNGIHVEYRYVNYTSNIQSEPKVTQDLKENSQ